MADFDTQIRESQEQVAAAQGKISELTSKIELLLEPEVRIIGVPVRRSHAVARDD